MVCFAAGLTSSSTNLLDGYGCGNTSGIGQRIQKKEEEIRRIAEELALWFMEKMDGRPDLCFTGTNKSSFPTEDARGSHLEKSSMQDDT